MLQLKMCFDPIYAFQNVSLLLTITTTLVVLSFMFFAVLLYKKYKPAEFFYGLLLSIAVHGLVLFLSYFTIIYLFETKDDSNSIEFFPLNAAIKNTCILDPNKQNCPTSLEELVAIEPERFTEILSDNRAYYEYDTESGDYTLIVLEGKTRRASIFSPKLNKILGRDFVDSSYSFCDGQFVINNKPDFPGLWDKTLE